MFGCIWCDAFKPRILWLPTHYKPAISTPWPPTNRYGLEEVGLWMQSRRYLTPEECTWGIFAEESDCRLLSRHELYRVKTTDMHGWRRVFLGFGLDDWKHIAAWYIQQFNRRFGRLKSSPVAYGSTIAIAGVAFGIMAWVVNSSGTKSLQVANGAICRWDAKWSRDLRVGYVFY